MSTGMYAATLFGIGPLMALGLVMLRRWQKHREDVAAWERGQDLRRRLRTSGVAVDREQTFAQQPPMTGRAEP